MSLNLTDLLAALGLFMVLEGIAPFLNPQGLKRALAWLLQRSPNILLIPGTSSRAHLRENLAAAELTLPQSAIEVLDTIQHE